MLYTLFGISLLMSLFGSSLKKINEDLKMTIEVFCFLFMWFFLGWSSGAYDIQIGINRYVNFERYSSFTEIGFQSLVIIGHKIGLDYRQFYVVMSLLELLVLFYFIHQHTKNTLLIIGLFMFYPMIMVFQYTRNNIAFMFVLLAMNTMINRKKHYQFKFLLLILLAAIFHASSLFFLLVLFYDFFKNEKKLWIMTILLFICLLFSKSFPVIFNTFSKLVGDEKMNMVLSTTNYDGQLGRSVALVIGLSVFWIPFIVYKNHRILNMSDSFNYFTFRLNLLCLLLIPLTINFGAGFNRIASMIMVVNFCFLGHNLEKIKFKNNKMLIYAVVFDLVLLLFLNFRNEALREALLYPMFEQNELIK